MSIHLIKSHLKQCYLFAELPDKRLQSLPQEVSMRVHIPIRI